MRSGIETSCDETGIAIYSQRDGLMAHRVHSQIDVHAHYVGSFLSLFHATTFVISSSGYETAAASGLIGLILMRSAYDRTRSSGRLVVGATFGKALAFSLDRPARDSSYGGSPPCTINGNSDLQIPFVALLVSGIRS